MRAMELARPAVLAHVVIFDALHIVFADFLSLSSFYVAI
jgi:hypothetical protein